MPLYVDPMACTGCKICQTVCSFVKEGKIWPAVARVEIVREKNGKDYVNACRNCKNPKCMEACIYEAIKFIDDQVQINMMVCTGCGACVRACPFNAIKIHPVYKKAVKCDFCGRCVEFCPPGVLKMR